MSVPAIVAALVEVGVAAEPRGVVASGVASWAGRDLDPGAW